MLAIFKRELKSYFISPIGYVCLGIFFLFEGLYFYALFKSGSPDLTVLFSAMFTIAMFLIPVLTMRLFSEDKRQKIDQAYFTAPVSLWAIALGKFLAALLMFVIAYAPTFVFQIVLSLTKGANPDWLVYIGNLIGILLFGSSMIAIGMFISSLTESQIVAAIGSFALSFLIISIDSLSSIISISWISTVTGWLSFSERYNTFVSGTFDIANFIFFLSFAAVFIFLTVRILEKKRYA